MGMGLRNPRVVATRPGKQSRCTCRIYNKVIDMFMFTPTHPMYIEKGCEAVGMHPGKRSNGADDCKRVQGETFYARDIVGQLPGVQNSP